MDIVDKALSFSWPKTLCTPEWWPMIILLSTVVIPDPAILPTATLSLVVTLLWSARLPMAVLLFPRGVSSERFPTDGRVGAAGGIIHQRKVTSGSVGATAVVKDECVGSNSGVV